MITFQPLRELIAARKISTYYLRNKCGIYNLDNKTIKRLLNDESVSTHTINALCNILGCGLSDIMEFSPDERAEQI
jgi:DNA-binding Xre family transcriptional regulator